ncbi:MAG TPA: 3-keto-5-aminohexanoate cleavage protein [Thermomicrobiales bacterium]|nr:3-keto-5-aminohexanoate cleavage protein [Chloroflexota bacterium]HCG28643.1 3-keto-5-aminohexanoate cleavage protein [Chloroflexota bacterium]HQX63263.1 3-keto-5-aminohexanoate cleavage protein [Thermomicrobiales bacterium]HQZ88988.1 3-keto-5-aminohexanoate cleavage protein [Thermomicrobiales bacterium]HRA31457.1 3-keto-5-aminohexanoate cleavage protein [Thermomicrobiales bacterium]
MDKLIISAALTGSRTSRAQTPYVPITEEEIAQQAVECWRAGAAIVHIHVRDQQGRVSCDAWRYQKVTDLVRAAGSDVIMNWSTGGGAGIVTDDDRTAPVRNAPEVASFDCGSTNFGDGVFINSPAFLDNLAREMNEHLVTPEIEIFDSGMVENARQLIADGLLQPPYWFQFVLGLRGGAPATARELTHLVDSLPPDSRWSVCAIGRNQLPMNVMAIAMGGHARTGLEDNIYYGYRQLAISNAQLVERIARLAEELGRPIARPDEAREIIGVAARRGVIAP